jgi:hypothetical protein
MTYRHASPACGQTCRERGLEGERKRVKRWFITNVKGTFIRMSDRESARERERARARTRERARAHAREKFIDNQEVTEGR